MAGVAEKVTEAPLQTGLFEGEIDTLTGRFGFTVIVTVFELAGFPSAQMALEVKRQVMASEFDGTYEQLEFVAPVMLDPLTFH